MICENDIARVGLSPIDRGFESYSNHFHSYKSSPVNNSQIVKSRMFTKIKLRALLEIA